MQAGKGKYILAVLASAFLWGFMGLVTRLMGSLGVAPGGIIFIRCSLAAVMFGITLIFTDLKQFRIKLRDFWCFLGTGILSSLFFTYCYFTATTIMSLSAASILLYTAPVMVVIMSSILFKESFGINKLIALILSLIGCALVSGIVGSDVKISARGLFLGLCAGFGYALYSIFARFAINRGYSSNTINFYSSVITAVGAALLFGISSPIAIMFSSVNTLLLCLAVAFFSCYLPYMFYTYGLTGLPSGTASIIATIEPVVASLVGIIIYKETLSLPAFLGIVLVLGAVILLNVKQKGNS
ncbi:MAG: EamA family transporter [Ruminococcaceae bacterium]|nr:EamA family transporter [Oscillospiraceae bacterium]